MDKITFQIVVDNLKCGREIEFFYNEKQYSITNSKGYWNFCCDTENMTIERICPFEDKETLVARVSELCIEDVPISKIFGEEGYKVSKICIL